MQVTPTSLDGGPRSWPHLWVLFCSLAIHRQALNFDRHGFAAIILMRFAGKRPRFEMMPWSDGQRCRP